MHRNTNDDELEVGSNDARGGLGGAAARGALVTLVSQVVRLIAQLAGIAVLARILQPADYGLIAIAIAFVGFGEVVRDFGLSSAAIQAKSVSPAQKSNLFWLNTGIGLILVAITLPTSSVIAHFYGGGAELQAVLCALSATFLLNGMSAQYRAQLNRDLRFVALAVSSTAGSLIALVAAVTLGLWGAGVWALVAQQLCVIAIPLVLMVIQARWLPGLPKRHVPMRQFITYGGNLMVAQMVNYLSRNIDSLIIGKRFGPEALGFYDRAFQMLMLPLNQLNAPSTSVALPVLASLQDDKIRYDRYLLRGQTVMVTLIAGLFAFTGSQAADLVRVFLGPTWGTTADVFAVLAFAGVFQVVSYATYWVFLSKGLTKSNLKFALISRPLVIVVIAAGSAWGVIGVATAYSVALLGNWVFGLWWVGRFADAPAMSMFVQGGRTVVCALGIALITRATSAGLLMDESLPVRVAVSSVVFLLSAIVVAVVCRPFRRDVLTCYSFGKDSILRRSS